MRLDQSDLDKPPVAVGNVGVQSVGHGEVEIVAEGLEVWKEQQDLSDNDLNVPSLTIVQVFPTSDERTLYVVVNIKLV